jgi:TolA-binding protein
MKHLILITSLLALSTACSSPRSNVTEQDAYGNYVTTSDYQSMERTEFQVAMKAGLKDFDARLADLRGRANELGGDSLKEFSDQAEKLDELRTDFVNELEKADASLEDDWAEQREHTVEAYDKLRKGLDHAYDEVLEES